MGLRAGIAFCFLVASAGWLRAAMAAPDLTVAFAPPVLDGVRREAGAATDGPATDLAATDLTTYVFEGGHDWPALRYRAARALDWRRAGALAVEVENLGDAPVRLLLRLDDDPGADGGDASLTGTAEVGPHARETLVLPLGGPEAPGMRGRPPGAAAADPGERIVTEARGRVDLGHVVALHVSGVRAPEDRRLRIGPPRLRGAGPRPQAGPLADAFGQWTGGTWPGKIASVAQLRDALARAAADTRRLAATAPPAADPYGGLDPTTRLRATGFFRVERVAGRWSLITPAGHRFFSLGVDTVAASNPTLVAGRAFLFTDPPRGAPSLDVGALNLARGLGAGWRERWPRAVAARLRAWGFNTLGTWSEPAVIARAHMPYVAFTDVEGESAAVPMDGGRALPDPFDSRFPAVADAVTAVMTAGPRRDPFLLGYFSGNELPWGRADRPDAGIAAAVLRLGPDSPAKRALVDELRARYLTPEAFAVAHGLPAATSWADLLARPFAWPAPMNAAARRDAAAFGGRFADLYFGTVAGALKRHDPDHLYLGTRFAGAPPEVMAACARFCDVVSVNLYGPTPAGEAASWRGLGRPVLIGEFHFGSTDRGSFWPGMAAVPDEAARGPAYAAYLRAALEDPQIVGAHWYQYADEPLTGRPYDGENGHIGLVAVTDVPYAGFVAAVAAANRAAMRRFAGPSGGPLGLRGTQ